jgi:hypothetical protein
MSWLGVGVTALAVFRSVLVSIIRGFRCAVLGIPWDLTQLETWRVIDGLDLCILLMPIAITILATADVKFNMGLAWIMLRSSAESLKKEIYFYRMQIGAYTPEQTQEDSRDVKLARRMRIIGQRLMETPVNQTGLVPYHGDLPPYAALEDDGFSDMTPTDYLAWRLGDQSNYYGKKATRLSQQLTRFQWSIYIFGGAGTFLAAIDQELWVAVTSSLAAAMTSLLEFQRVEPTLISCNQAASDLYNVRAWWRALPVTAQQQQANIEVLVENTENIIQAENAGWVQEMRDALAEVYGDQEHNHETEADTAQKVNPKNQPDQGDQALAPAQISDRTTDTVATQTAQDPGSNATLEPDWNNLDGQASAIDI